MMKRTTILVLALLSCALTGCGTDSEPTGIRVAVIGLDGATWDLIDPWMEEGLLPNLARLKREGFTSELQSVIPALSAPAWTTAVTGVNPGKHGIFDFELVDREMFMPVPATALDRKAKAVWEYMTESNRRSVVITIPVTSPPDEVNGVMISGFPHLKQTGYTWPPEMEDRLSAWRLDRYGEYLPPGGEAAFLANLIATREARFRAAIDLYREGNWDLFWAVFMGTDKAQHFFWQFMDPGSRQVDDELLENFQSAIRDFWIRMDEMMGEFIDATADDTILFVVSDHGFRPVDRELMLLKWLWNEGYCHQNPPLSRVLYFPHLGGRMTINTTDRFKRGVVEPGAEYDALVDELKGKLIALRDPLTGERAVEKVHRSDEIYSGPCLADGPDLLLESGERFLFSRGSPMEGGSLFGAPSFTFSAYHNRRGILMARGPHIRKGVGSAKGKPSLQDLTPTIMRILGETVPREMDGVTIDGLFESSIDEAAPLREGGRSIERRIPEEKIRKERDGLRALPYLG